MVRLKTRYLLFDLIYPDVITSDYDALNPSLNTVNIHAPSKTSVDMRLLNRVFRDAVRDAYGEYGAGSVANTIAVKYFSPATSTGILRVSRQHHQLAWAGLSLIQSLDGREVIVQVVHISGTIKKCEQAAISRNKAMVEKIRKSHIVSGSAEGKSTLDRFASAADDSIDQLMGLTPDHDLDD